MAKQQWKWTPAQVAALAFGLWWVGNGLAVFIASDPGITALADDGTVEAGGLAIAVNGWHGLFHLATGLAGIAVCRSPQASLAYALVAGALYLAAALWSLTRGAAVFGLIQVDALGSADHAVEGVVLLAAWLASRESPLPLRDL
jgi:uncharacterized protein DUF4383